MTKIDELPEDRTNKSDRQLGMDRSITRRDFLDGVGIAIGGAIAASVLPALDLVAETAEAFAQDRPGYYPPVLTGMRGSTDGSYEAAHALRDGDFWKKAGQPRRIDDVYDLIVVGGGLSGLAAAYFYRKQEPSARILILDNHDDFGGHAKRNEFHPGGRLLLANGGTWAIESPFPYSKEAAGLMADLQIDPAALAEKCDVKDAYKNLQSAYFFDKETFGSDKFVTGGPGRRNRNGANNLSDFVQNTPLSENARRDFLRLNETTVDFFPGLSSDEKKDRLSRMSYKDYLLKVVKVDPGVIPVYQVQTQGLYGVGVDAVSALDCWVLRSPGFAGLNLAPGPHPRMGFTARGFATPKPDYEFHYPDGNASIARMLVRVLIPGSIGGKTAEDIVTAKADYRKLDQSSSAVRIRLNSTAVHARHVGDVSSAREVEVSYSREGKLYSVLGKGAVMACWNTVIPYVCPELPQPQKDALLYGTKVPLVYTSVAIKNWKAFEKLGVYQVSCPGMYHTHVSLDNAVTIGDYKAPLSPEEPILVRLTKTPCAPGLPEREQHKVGRAELLETPFDIFERKLRDQLYRVLGGGGFDPARDIDAITVNRWPHGYAYEYNPLFDPDWPPGQSPCEIGRKPFGRITIANADAAAAAYTDQAMDQAYRAVQELARIPA
jgi:spermidine dehydrogenase